DSKLEAVDIAAALGRLFLIEQLPIGAEWMLNQHDALLSGAILDVVRRRLPQLVGRMHDPLDDLDADQLLRRVLGDWLDLNALIDGEGNQALFLGLQIEDAGVASVGGPLEDGDRPLHEMRRRRVLHLEPEQRMLRLNG